MDSQPKNAKELLLQQYASIVKQGEYHGSDSQITAVVNAIMAGASVIASAIVAVGDSNVAARWLASIGQDSREIANALDGIESRLLELTNDMIPESD